METNKPKTVDEQKDGKQVTPGEPSVTAPTGGQNENQGAGGTKEPWGKLPMTDSEKRAVVIRAIYDTIVAAGIVIAGQTGLLFYSVLEKQQGLIGNRERGVSEDGADLNPLDARTARAIAEKIALGIELGLALKEHERDIEYLWESVRGDRELDELLHAFFRPPLGHISATSSDLRQYLAKKTAEHMRAQLPG